MDVRCFYPGRAWCPASITSVGLPQSHVPQQANLRQDSVAGRKNEGLLRQFQVGTHNRLRTYCTAICERRGSHGRLADRQSNFKN